MFCEAVLMNKMFNKLRGDINERRIRYYKNDQHSPRNFDVSNAGLAKAIIFEV